MSSYNVALFIHLLGVITLFAAIAIQQRTGVRLRTASSVQEIRLWMGFLRPTGQMNVAAVLILLASGLYMTAQQWSLRTPWVATGLVAILAMASVGAAVLGRRFRAIGIAAAAASDGPVPSDLDRLVKAPATWATVAALNGAALAVLWLMANKPGWAASIAIVVGVSAIGGYLGAVLARRARPSQVPAGS